MAQSRGQECPPSGQSFTSTALTELFGSFSSDQIAGDRPSLFGIIAFGCQYSFIFLERNMDNPSITSKPIPSIIRAAQYLRMSTEDQRYSTDNQAAAIQIYAVEHGFEIVSTYLDSGKSGVTTERRAGLRQLVHDVEAGECKFKAILVYDVSRWGRFQNPDDAAMYEVRCLSAGVPVHYCAEQFENDGSVISSIMKALKRAMAAEYSRELSVKVTEGHLRMLERGFYQGSSATYGLQRVLIDADGKRKRILGPGEHKNIQSDRVVLELGPAADVVIVNELFSRYLAGETQAELIMDLNNRGIFGVTGKRWTEGLMRRLLTSEAYIGNIVWGKNVKKLGMKAEEMPRSAWVRNEGAFSAAIDPALFWRVQDEMIARRNYRYSDEEMLQLLRDVLKQHGTITRAIINRAPKSPSARLISQRFGTMIAAYTRVGFVPPASNQYVRIKKQIARVTARVGKDICKRFGSGFAAKASGPFCLFERADETVVLMIARYIKRFAGPEHWLFDWDKLPLADICMVARMEKGNLRVRDYYVMRTEELTPDLIRRRRSLGAWLNRFKQGDLKSAAAKVCLLLEEQSDSRTNQIDAVRSNRRVPKNL